MAESFFSKTPDQVSAVIAGRLLLALASYDAVIGRRQQASQALVSLAMPTVSMLFSAHTMVRSELEKDPALQHLLWAHSKVRSSIPSVPVPTAQAGSLLMNVDPDRIDLTGEQAARIVQDLVSQSLEIAVRKVIRSADGPGAIRSGEAISTTLARSIVERVERAMIERYVKVTYEDASSSDVIAYFALNPQTGKAGKEITEREYYSLRGDPTFRVVRAVEESDGTQHFQTERGDHLFRPRGGEIDEYEPDGSDADDPWDDSEKFRPLNVSRDADKEARAFLADGVARMKTTRESSKGISGIITEITPSTVSLRTDERGPVSVRREAVKSLEPVGNVAFALLPVSSDILAEIQHTTEGVLVSAFLTADAEPRPKVKAAK